jgi:DNA-binding NarL/FixJ family response regulator
LTDLIKTEKNKVILNILDNLKSEFNVTSRDIILILESHDRSAVPIEIFAERKLSALQALAKYLRENLDYSNKQISSALKKDSRSIWSAYEQSKTRKKMQFDITKSSMTIPIEIFSHDQPMLGSLIIYLKEMGWSNKKIAATLKRSATTTSTIFGRMSKNGKKKQW